MHDSSDLPVQGAIRAPGEAHHAPVPLLLGPTAGGKSADEARVYVAKLKSDKRYQRDVY